MLLSDDDQNKLLVVAENSLDTAEARWNEVAPLLKKAREVFRDTASIKIPSRFPGIDIIDESKPLVREFFVLVADMRDSTQHIEGSVPMSSKLVNGMHRLYLEIATLLPTLAYYIKRQNGSVTEYLGDGLLAFFPMHNSENSKEFSAVVKCGDACVEICKEIISPLLGKRYNLPEIQIGIGISCGQAIVTTVGVEEDLRPIAFGVPVFGASKASNGTNQVILTPEIRKRWPKGKGGKRQFKSVRLPKNDYFGYKTWLSE